MSAVIQSVINNIGYSRQVISNTIRSKLPYSWSVNEWADFWRYVIGVNVIPADTRNKRTWVQWSEFQNKAIPKELHDYWKKNNDFSKGMAIILGKVWHIPHKQGLYFAFIDLDNQKAIDEFCTHSGFTVPLEQLAKRMIVEQHKDDLSRAHIYCYSTYPFVQKGHDTTKSADSPAFEVKGAGEHGLAYCTPSVHKNGSNYEIIRTNEPETLDVIEGHIDSICKKYGIPYQGSGNNTHKKTAKDLFNSKDKVYEGHNRHGVLLTEMCVLIKRNHEILPEEKIKELARQENQRICEPPLDQTEFEKQWKCAVKYIGRKSKEKQNNNNKNNETPKSLETELTEIYKFKSLKDTEEIYYWDEYKGIFLKGAEWLIKEECMKYDPELRSGNVTEIINHIIWSNYMDREELDSQTEWLATNNCMINLETLETKEHSPDFLATVRIPHDYNPMPATYEPLLSSDGSTLRELHSLEEWDKICKCPCPCPKIMTFLYQVVPPEDVETILDFMAYCLWRGFPFHKYLLLNGSGRNGKGVTIDLFKELLGPENISTESLQRILENRFACAKLFGKMANLDADLSNEALKNTGLLKKLTGADDIPAEFKFRNPFHFKNYAKLIFSANKMPITPDETDAFFARLKIVNFPNQYLGDKADSYLIKKLTTKEEMSGLFSLVVARLPRMLAKGIYGTDSSIEENYIKYIESSDPIRAFYEGSIRPDTGKISKEEVYNSYTKFCKDKKLNPESKDTFNRRLKGKYGILDAKGTKREDRQRYWVRIKLIDNVEAEEGQETF